MNKVIPRVKFDINSEDPNNGVKVISLVDQPAIESDFIFFNKELQKPKFIELKGEFKQVVAGLALIPDKDILRLDAEGNPYYGFFPTNVVEKIRNKFHKELLNNRVNTDHSSTNYIDAYMIESYIIDSEQRLADVKAKGIQEATIGSWFVAYKIEDAETFKRVLEGELKGFSVEVFLQRFYTTNNSDLNVFENVMNKFLEKLKVLLHEMEANDKEQKLEDKPAQQPELPKKMEQGKTADGAIIEYTVLGEPVNLIDAQGVPTPAPDGEYTLDSGKIITVASAVATDIKDAPVHQAKEEIKQPEANKEHEALKTEIQNLKAEIEKLKKAPLTNPVTKKEVKVENIDLSKLSNADKLRLKYNIN